MSDGARDDDADGFSAASHVEGLTSGKRRDIDERSRPSAALIHETIRAEGESELERKPLALFLSAIAAGLSMGFSLLTQGVLRTHLPDENWALLISSFGYTTGFVIVVLGRQQLFTENTLTPVLPLLHNRDGATLRRLSMLWAVVLAGNLLATFAIAAVLAHGPAFDAETKAAFLRVAEHAIRGDFGAVFWKSIFAGWLIALMVWLLPAAESARFFVIVTITYLVAILELSHLIAGSVDAFYLLLEGRASVADYLLRFFAPTFLGNVIGGVALVAALNFGQVAPEVE